jgi:hypothetical protein
MDGDVDVRAIPEPRQFKLFKIRKELIYDKPVE